MKKNKYQYLVILQGQFDGQWADIIARDERCTREERKQWLDDLKTYRENDPRPYRTIHRRMPADQLFHA